MSKLKLHPKVVAIVKQAITNIKAHPESFDMGHWYGRFDTDNPALRNGCGTSACLAGHIVLASGLKPTRPDSSVLNLVEVKQKLGGFVNETDLVLCDEDENEDETTIERLAAALLQLSVGSSSDTLFLVDAWPDKFRYKFEALSEVPDSKKVLRQRANLAVARLNHYLRTGE